MEPRLVKAYTDNEGNVVQEVKPKTVRQVVSTETSKKMLSVMESVVTDGGGKIAYLPGYRLGGKTGTAQKVIDGVYAQGKYICSFISVAPVDDPQIVVLAIVDEPTDVVAFGSTTAGPIIKEVMSQSLEYLGVKKEYTKEEKEELQEAGCSLGTGDRAMQKANLDRYEARLVQRIAELQKGLPERKRLCQSLGIMGGLFLFLILV